MRPEGGAKQPAIMQRVHAREQRHQEQCGTDSAAAKPHCRPNQERRQRPRERREAVSSGVLSPVEDPRNENGREYKRACFKVKTVLGSDHFSPPGSQNDDRRNDRKVGEHVGSKTLTPQSPEMTAPFSHHDRLAVEK